MKNKKQTTLVLFLFSILFGSLIIVSFPLQTNQAEREKISLTDELL